MDTIDPGLAEDAKLHDIDVLPHHHSSRRMKDFFLVARVDPDIDEFLDYEREIGSVPEVSFLAAAASVGQ